MDFTFDDGESRESPTETQPMEFDPKKLKFSVSLSTIFLGKLVKMKLLIKTKMCENNNASMKHVDTIHFDSDQVLVREIRKQVSERLKMEYGSFDIVFDGKKLENGRPASFYEMVDFDTIFVVPQIVSIEPSEKSRASTGKSSDQKSMKERN